MTFLKISIIILLFVFPFISSAQKIKDYNARGLAKANVLDYKGAIVEYNKGLILDSNNVAILYNSGIAKAKLMNNKGAIKDYTKSINLVPAPDKYYNRGLSYYKISANQEALLDFDKALELNPTFNPQIYFERGATKFNLSNYKDAIPDFTKAIEFNPANAKAYFNRGIAEYYI